MAATEVSDKRWDDLIGSDPEDSDDNCASEETEKAYHGIPSVYDGLDPDAEMLFRFNRYRARRQEKKDADKGRRRRSEQQERVFTVRAQDARALAQDKTDDCRLSVCDPGDWQSRRAAG